MSQAVVDREEAAPAEAADPLAYFPSGVRGWLAPEEGRQLEELARDKTVLEIGSFAGLSTLCMARTARLIHTVDWHRGDPDTHRYSGENCDTLPELVANLTRHNVRDRVVIHAGSVEDVVGAMSPAQFDLVFIDGAHDLDSVCRDATLALRVVKPDGLLAFHDAGFDTVGSVLRHLAPQGPLGQVNSLAWVKPPAPQSPPATQRANVYVGVPCYGPIVPQAACSVYWAVNANSDAVANWSFDMGGGSLLARSFNNHLTVCLNQRKAHGWTRFALHHADIEAQKGWLDILAKEMERTGADILSAVVPIKDDRGLTSCGLQAMPGGNVRRLTMKEIYDLPETFDAKDAGARDDECLAVNTGLMLVDVSRPWVDEFPGFNISDRIVRLEDGNFLAFTLPEDWAFSLWAAERGLKVMATRKAKVLHHGGTTYGNHEVWGRWQTEQGDTLRLT